MKIKNIDSSNFVGLCLGLMLCNQSIRAITYYNLIGIFFLLLIISFTFYCIKYYPRFSLRLPLGEIIILTSYLLVVVYACFSLLETGGGNVVFIADLLSLILIYIIARLIDLSAYKMIVFTVFFIGFVHALMLIYARAYIYSSGVNYLLLSLVIGLFTCFSLIGILMQKKILFKLIFVGLYFVGWIALFAMQSRATFIYVALYSFIVPFFIMSGKKRLVFLVSLSLTISALFIYFYNEIVLLYEASKVYQRMDSLFNNFGNEQRFITYGLYFSKISDFFPTGFGVGGTTEGIYSTTVEKYPHNFILEFFSEFGVIGLIFSVIFIFNSLFVSFCRIRREFWSLTIFSLFFFYLMNFNKSFSIYDSSMLFLAIGLIFNKKIFLELKNK